MNEHTRGPLTSKGLQDWSDGERRCWIGPEDGGYAVCHVFHLAHDEGLCDVNARLLAAAYNSYDKHCGPDAVKWAEDDLLGELLQASTKMAEFILKWKDALAGVAKSTADFVVDSGLVEYETARTKTAKGESDARAVKRSR